MLDIIVPHWKEDWKTVGKKFFDMLNLQRGVDFEEIRVILVNDGEENALPDEYFNDYQYHVDNYTILHAGVSAARNYGLDKADAEWVSFSDFDDVYSTVYSLKMVMDMIHKRGKDYDCLWAPIVAEDQYEGEKGLRLIWRSGKEMDMVFLHGKYYRRSFIVEHNIRFDEHLEFNEDSAFNAICNTHWDYRRTGKIVSDVPIYSWCYRPGSLTGTPENLDRAILGAYERNKIVCKAFLERLPYERYCAMIARTVFDCYYNLNVPNLTPLRAEILEDFKSFYREHKEQFWSVPRETMKEVKAIAAAEALTGQKEQSLRWPGNPQNPTRQEISVTKWLESIEGVA